MFFKFIVAVITMVSIGACAEPKYENILSGDPGPQNPKTTADCKVLFKNSSLCLSWSWENKPTESDQGSLVFKTYRINSYDGTAISVDADVMPNVVLWMPSMGHGSTPTQVSRLDVGTYRAANVFFVMPGEWEIKFQLKDGSTIKDEVVVSITI